jgi:hypothetical protein
MVMHTDGWFFAGRTQIMQNRTITDHSPKVGVSIPIVVCNNLFIPDDHSITENQFHATHSPDVAHHLKAPDQELVVYLFL